jgi:hypothetical protein
VTNEANPDRHAGEIEAEHDGGEDDGGHHGGGSGDSGPEVHDEHTCTAPKLP